VARDGENGAGNLAARDVGIERLGDVGEPFRGQADLFGLGTRQRIGVRGLRVTTSPVAVPPENTADVPLAAPPEDTTSRPPLLTVAPRAMPSTSSVPPWLMTVALARPGCGQTRHCKPATQAAPLAISTRNRPGGSSSGIRSAG
jgi:hypothetical protein